MRQTGSILCFGELLLRLNPVVATPLARADMLALHAGGAEANVAAALAALGHDAAMASMTAANDLGEAACRALRAAGVDLRFVARGAGRQGLYFLTPGASLRPAQILYDREESSFTRHDWSSTDWPALLAGRSWLHVSGITPALGPDPAAATLAAMRAARAAGVSVSFDANYRERLWSRWSAEPRDIVIELAAEADLFFATHRDMSLLLGRRFHGDGPARRREAAEAAFAALPRLRWMASTAREVEAVDRHRLSARIDTRTESWTTEEVMLTGVVDRIGGGDAFAAGVLHGLMRGAGEAAAIRDGLALACLKHSVIGDMALFTRADLEEFGSGGLDVRR
ncbi:sugar kinase [Sphingomonas alpina]|uniref:Sugar kinase n=1 Tax=Sphingomonas alpina TaxID=653931 RepID=A0A7H0LMA4_9SPHN|nr:sugar kinase [Sphingomonas alpina]QNQ10807.1 sugar kinase [Sphingomonas alpina]